MTGKMITISNSDFVTHLYFSYTIFEMDQKFVKTFSTQHYHMLIQNTYQCYTKL